MRIDRVCWVYLLAMLITSCGGFDQLMKSRDYEKQYSEALRYYQIKKDNKAVQLFMNVEPIFTGTERIDTIKFYTAKAVYRMGEYKSAQELFDEFRKTFTRSIFAEEAEFLYAMSYYESSPNSELDQSDSALGLLAFTDYLNRHPDSPRTEACLEMIDEMQTRLIDYAFNTANTYYNIGYYNSAIHAFKNVLKDNSEFPYKEEVMYRIVKANYLYAKASVRNKQRERYLNTIDAYYNFVEAYPESEYSKELERVYNTSTRLSKLSADVSKFGDDFDGNARKIERQEAKALKITEKGDDETLSEKDREKHDRELEKKLEKIDAMIAKEKKKQRVKKAENEVPTEISLTGEKVIKDSNTSVKDAVSKEGAVDDVKEKISETHDKNQEEALKEETKKKKKNKKNIENEE